MEASDTAKGELLEGHYKTLFECNPIPMLVVAHGTFSILSANNSAAYCFGYTLPQLLALNLVTLFHLDDWISFRLVLESASVAPLVRGHWRQRRSSGVVFLMETQITRQRLAGIDTSTYMLLMREVRPASVNAPVYGQLFWKPPIEIETEFFQIDRATRFTFVNARAEVLIHRRSHYLLSQISWDWFLKPVDTGHHFRIMLALQGQLPSCYEVFYPQCRTCCRVHFYPTEHGVSSHFYDAGEHHEDLQRLNQEHNRLSAFINASHDAMIFTNKHGEIQTFSPSAERIFGVKQSEILGKNVDQLLPERFRKAHASSRQAFAEGTCFYGRTMVLRRVKGLRSDGIEIDLEGSIVNVQVAGQKVLIITLRDVTFRQAIEEEQQKLRIRLSQLTDRLIQQEKALIKQVSIALHDQLGQTLAAVRIVHETMSTIRCKGRKSKDIKLFNQLGSLIDQSIRQVRLVLTNLYPPILDECGLIAALGNELRNRSLSQTRMQLVLNAQPDVASLRWPASVEYAVFMIAREAVEYAIHHSGGNQLNIAIAGGPMDLTLDVRNDGMGFSLNTKLTVDHLGLTGMYERARQIGAQLTLNAGEGGGAHLNLHWNATP